MYSCSAALKGRLHCAPQACAAFVLRSSRRATMRRFQLERSAVLGRSSHLCHSALGDQRVLVSNAPASNNASLFLSSEQSRQSRDYLRLVLQQNTTMNLTGATNEEEAFVMHVEDSLALLPVLDKVLYTQNTTARSTGASPIKIIDVGSGGGLPGVILAIARPDWQVTLLDSLRKRCSFVQKAVSEVGLQNVEVVWSRAEEAGQGPQHREVYNIAVARAVARMPVLAELCLPFVKPGGHWVAAKGPDVQAELADAEKAIKVLQGRTPVVTAVNAFGSLGQHVAVVVEKLAATPPQYPRQPGKPNKRPL